MEFVNYDEAIDALQKHGLLQAQNVDGDRLALNLQQPEKAVHFHLTDGGEQVEPAPQAKVVTLDREQLVGIIENIIHKLHLTDILLMPVRRWRQIFDAVAFRLVENEEWQEIDAAATVEFNTRDPLLCDSRDMHTLTALIGALLTDAEDDSHALLLTTTAAPLIAEIVPAGAIRLVVGNPTLADEIEEILPG